MKHQVLLYYKYVTIRNPEKFAAEHRVVCERLGLKGRIIIAEEGINGTLEGLVKDTRAYQAFLSAKRGFKDIHWKKSLGTGAVFPRMSIKVRPEIVSLSLKRSRQTDVDPRKVTGRHLAPKDLNAWFRKGEKFTIIDMRNDYEHKVGAFDGSVLPPLKNFRDLPKAMRGLKKHAKERVLTVCTGGVRCEKASGYLIKKGFKDVYQLDGGIVSYMEKYPGKHFNGALYVFDGRVTMAFDPKKGKRTIIGRCEHCEASTEAYRDCAVASCKKQMLVCPSCLGSFGVYCREHATRAVASK
ncbi:MAG: rhodanese-related sulfurtransferase [Candidatus Paceibacterota bacterium]|jgi:UPF0176 protein